VYPHEDEYRSTENENAVAMQVNGMMLALESQRGLKRGPKT